MCLTLALCLGGCAIVEADKRLNSSVSTNNNHSLAEPRKLMTKEQSCKKKKNLIRRKVWAPAEAMCNHRTRHPGCMAAVRGATAKMPSHEARLLQAKVTGRFCLLSTKSPP